MQTRILLTGGCGFLGHHVVNHLLVNTDWNIVILDRLSYASNGFDRLRDIKVFDNKRILCIATDFSQPISAGVAKEIGDVHYILHMGAETHVDNSIKDPVPFIISNVLGTHYILKLAENMINLKLMLYASTDEVMGPAPMGVDFKETDVPNPTNPYAATKMGAEALCMAYANTYKIPVAITRTMNLFGERQHGEKYVPLCINKILNSECIYIHANPAKTVSGSRFWLHCRNYAAAALFLLKRGRASEIYNVVGNKEVSNLDMADMIASIVGKPLFYEMTNFHASRPGHDLRYSLCGKKLRQMGWKHPVTFEDSLSKTIHWFLKPNNKRWLEWE